MRQVSDILNLKTKSAELKQKYLHDLPKEHGVILFSKTQVL